MSDSNDYRVVVVVNKRVDIGAAMNAVLHLGAAITNFIKNSGREALQFLDFLDGDDRVYPSISAKSFIVLKAKNGELRKLQQRSEAQEIPVVAFTSSMTGETFKEQLVKTRDTASEDLEFYGVALFGRKEELGSLTRKFSLFN